MADQSAHPHIFAGQYIDRAARLRNDESWLTQARNAPESRYVPVWKSLSLVSTHDGRRAAFLHVSELVDRGIACDDAIFLGLYRELPVFAVELEADTAAAAAMPGDFVDLWRIGRQLPADEAGVLAYARAMVAWRSAHLYCGRSGERNQSALGGHILTGAGGHKQFPRVDPAIIVLVSDGDRCLLGRQSSWPEDRYSTVAGFVEPGESLEDAVMREVFEETNISTRNIRYHSSQPWPFPASLMLGFHADAATTEIRLNDDELADARWFSSEALCSGAAKLPPRLSISFKLIESWFDSLGGARLASQIGDQDW